MLRIALISVVGLFAIGMPMYLSYSAEVAEEQVPIPKLVLSSKEKNGSQLSWDYQSFLKDGKLEEGKSIPFKDSKMKLGDYQLKVGDSLCSPDQDGNYLVMRKKEGRNAGYAIEGNKQTWWACPRRGFLKSNPDVKTFQFKGFPIGENLYSSTIFISSCFFELRKSRGGSRLEIMWDKCKEKELFSSYLRKAPMLLDDQNPEIKSS